MKSSVDVVDFSYSDSVTVALPHSPPVTVATISGRRCLTQDMAVKKTLELELCWEEVRETHAEMAVVWSFSLVSARAPQGSGTSLEMPSAWSAPIMSKR